MSSQISSMAQRRQCLELISQHAMDQQHRFTILRENPLTLPNLLNLLMATTRQVEQDPEYTSYIHHYTSLLMRDIEQQIASNHEIDINALLPEILLLQKSQLSLPQQVQGTQAILSYLQTKARELIPHIMNEINTARQEEAPHLLLAYQRSLTELLPYLFTSEYPSEILKEANEYITYLTFNPHAGPVESQDELSAAITEIEALQAKYMDLQTAIVRVAPILKELLTLTLAQEEITSTRQEDGSGLLQSKSQEIIELTQYVQQLKTELIPLTQMLANSENLLISKERLLHHPSSSEEILEGIQAQAKIFKFLFSVYNTDVCIKKILIQNKPQNLEQSFSLITTVPHAPLSDDAEEQIQAIFDLNKQEITEAAALLGMQPTTHEIKDSAFAAAIDGWLTNLDGMILSIDTEPLIHHYLAELSEELYQIIFSGFLNPDDADNQVDNDIARQVSAIHQLFNQKMFNIDGVNWSIEDWRSFLINEIKTPLETLIKPQNTHDLEALIAQIDQLAAHIRTA